MEHVRTTFEGNYKIFKEWDEVVNSAKQAIQTLDRQDLLPHFEKVMKTMERMEITVEWKRNGRIVYYKDLSFRGLDILSCIARKFEGYGEPLLPLATKAHKYCIEQLNKDIRDRRHRSSIYDLLSALLPIVGEDMVTSFPVIMGHVCRDTICEKRFNEQHSHLKVSVLLVLKDYVEFMPKQFKPFIEDTLKYATRLINYQGELVRIASVDCISMVLNAFQGLGFGGKLPETCEVLIPVLSQVICADDAPCVVVKVITCLGDVFNRLKRNAVPNQEVADIVFKSIDWVFNDRTRCQVAMARYPESEEDYYEESFGRMYFEAAAMFANFGHGLEQEIFLKYFKRIHPHLGRLQTMIEAQSDETFYSSVSTMVILLETKVTSFFDFLYPILLAGFRHTSADQRKIAIYAMGVLILNTDNEKAVKAFPAIHLALCDRYDSETNAAIQDTVLGALGRMILSNAEGVPLDSMLLDFMSRLPLTEVFEENVTMLKVFRLLYHEKRQKIDYFVERILELTLLMVAKNEISDPKWRKDAIDFAYKIKLNYPRIFDKMIKTHKEIESLIHSMCYVIW
ncbi:uncharacterized protein Dana_GF24584, isoform D [Drosophila ananassae]|uniref:Uncharacterized protein, isoform D n=1 Tax=Drosophila ananassae TaxID=7217 RepID=A0A0P8YGB8_DROAN|nr:uncharacterized protein LOC6507216 isoform X2 [Drosophila ananassae]KPU77976.1 uncharacterized protein Dana_GF24584, isoform D [Drosophila ananassae]